MNTLLYGEILSFILRIGCMCTFHLWRVWYILAKGESWQCVGFYEVLEWICNTTYRFELPANMISIHPVFPVTMSRKLLGDPCTITPLEGIGVEKTWLMKKFRLRFLTNKWTSFITRLLHRLKSIGGTNILRVPQGKRNQIWYQYKA